MKDVKVIKRKFYKSLNNRSVTIVGDKVYQLISKEQISDLCKIMDASEKYELKDLLVPNHFICLGKGYSPCGYEMDYLDGYVTVGDALLDDVQFDRLDVIDRVLDVMFNLLEYGLVYYDMHVFNVMIKDDDVKVIDLLGIESSDEKADMCYGMLDFILQTLYGDNIGFFRSINLIENPEFIKKFSKEFIDYAKRVIHCVKGTEPTEIFKYLDEFRDEEKNRIIRELASKVDFSDRFMSRLILKHGV